MPSPQSAFVVYEPPTKGFPWLAVILLPDGTVIARRFDTPEEAAKYNSEMARVFTRAPANIEASLGLA